MLKIEIDLPQRAIDQLQKLVDDFNSQTDQSLTLEGWVVLRLREHAISSQLMSDVAAIKADVDAEVTRRIAARRRELLAEQNAAP